MKRLVSQYARDMRAGKWKCTHQGILLGKDDVVVDGQHRLLAVIECGVPQWMHVFHDDAFNTALEEPIDSGLKRSNSLVLGVSNQLAAIGSYAVRVTKGLQMISVADIKPFVEMYRLPFHALTNGTKHTKGGITKASVHLAATTRILLGDDLNYIRHIYSCMVSDKFTELSPLAASFYKQVVIDRTNFQESQLLARAIRVFDPVRSDHAKLQIKDETFAYEEAKAMVIAAIIKTDSSLLA